MIQLLLMLLLATQGIENVSASGAGITDSAETFVAVEPAFSWDEAVLCKGGDCKCSPHRLVEASLELRGFVRPSSDLGATLDIYRTPAQQLRYEAEQIERRDAAIAKWTEELAKCSWLSAQEEGDK